MKIRKATVVWNGSGKEGDGSISTQSQALKNAPYSWRSRFEEVQGTNPEELIGAAHAGCFTLKLVFLLNAAGYEVESIQTTAEITLSNDAISHSKLSVKGKVEGIEEDEFESLANDAGKNCIVSRALNMDISVDARLTQEQTA